MKKCSFCGRPEKKVSLLIVGKDGNICSSCAKDASIIVKEDEVSKGIATARALELAKPKELKSFLDQYVIGQNDAKKVISVAVYNHYKRIKSAVSFDNDGVEIEKSNIVLVGRTGTGKTLIAKTIAKELQVPFAIVDATVMTQAGYVGEDVESLLSRLLQAADYDIKATEKGIIFIDELDKIARKMDNPSITRDVSGEGVQQGLLKLLEGSVVSVPPEGGRKHPEQKLVKIDTKNILFICGGAFDGIEKIISKRLNTQVVGFNSIKDGERIDRENMLQYISPQDLKSYGLIPEIVGRIPALSYLEPLDKDALKRILIEPKNAIIKQYIKLLKMDGIKLEFTDEVLDYIVDKALEFKVGARGLRSICEAIMIDVMYDMDSDEDNLMKITLEYAKERVDILHSKKLKAA